MYSYSYYIIGFIFLAGCLTTFRSEHDFWDVGIVDCYVSSSCMADDGSSDVGTRGKQNRNRGLNLDMDYVELHGSAMISLMTPDLSLR